MKRHIPVQLLEILENLFRCCNSCVKWNDILSSVMEIKLGVRQGSVFSPFLFSLYLDDLSKLSNLFGGCYIVTYADNILLLSPSVTLLRKLLHVCECELAWFDMSINFSKSCCIRIRPCYDRTCISVKSLSLATVYHKTLRCVTLASTLFNPEIRNAH